MRGSCFKGRYTLGDKLQQHFAATVTATNRFVCTGEFCENLCLSNRILPLQQVPQILTDLIFCNMLLRQNSVAETKVFT